VFYFATIAHMLWGFNSGAAQFRSGWFVESLATQTLIIFAIRTRRVPFFHSHPSLPLTLAALAVVLVGVVIPGSPAGKTLGFAPLSAAFLAALIGMLIGYLVLVEAGKRLFYRAADVEPSAPRDPRPAHHLRRRAARFSTALPPREPPTH
jgi:Mg2+-importing ATPase